MEPLGLIAVGGAILGAAGLLFEIALDAGRFVAEGGDIFE